MKLLEQLFSIVRGIDERGSKSGGQGVRVGSKCHHAGLAADVICQHPAGLQECLMPQMDAVKKTQGKDRFLFHKKFL